MWNGDSGLAPQRSAASLDRGPCARTVAGDGGLHELEAEVVEWILIRGPHLAAERRCSELPGTALLRGISLTFSRHPSYDTEPSPDL